ncbi:MAG: RnfABCDGE type electron transport complex subunit G [Eubacterium sp.]|nr:RnfABCDGE type electron transport complex subunit G [Eubacterium sp.]
MNEKKSSMIKDAVILCLITLILGAVLAGVYAITKAPIDASQEKTNNEACQAVVAEGDSVLDNDAEAVKKALAYISSRDLSNAETKDGDLLANYLVIEQIHPTKNGGKVFLASATKGYGGAIGFALGVDANGAITGISITSQSETAGLGANCENEDWLKGFAGKVAPQNASSEMYNKNESNDSQVQALSGATVTSRAITRAVKGILFFDGSERGAN